jgi:hypothetical protein
MVIEKTYRVNLDVLFLIDCLFDKGVFIHPYFFPMVYYFLLFLLYKFILIC